MRIRPQLLALSLIAAPLTAEAANYGTDLNLTMLPAAGGMGGVGIARPQEPAAAVFGNPASLTQFNQGTAFSFGATFYRPEVNANHNGGDTGVPWSGKSKAGDYLVPAVAVTQAFGSATVIGAGLTAISGVGSDFRGIPGSLDPLAELIVFGANIGIGHRVSQNFSVGATLTLANGFFQAGLSSNTATRHDFGWRGTVGANYQTGPVSVGGYYRSKLSITYDDVVNYGPNKFWTLKVEQPQELAIGVAADKLMGGDLLLAADVIWKNWSNATFYKDIYDDQTVIALGAQLRRGKATWRVGYSHAPSPIKSNVGSSVGNATSLAYNGVNIPLTPSLVQYLQATNAEVIWENQATLGLGYQLSKNVQLDAHFASALNRSETIGNTRVDAKAWQLGVGLTWRFY